MFEMLCRAARAEPRLPALASVDAIIELLYLDCCAPPTCSMPLAGRGAAIAFVRRGHRVPAVDRSRGSRRAPATQ